MLAEEGVVGKLPISANVGWAGGGKGLVAISSKFWRRDRDKCWLRRGWQGQVAISANVGCGGVGRDS
jgi:hypothetical protein